MRIKRVNRYYCDFCKKANCSAASIRRHESSCTMNPNRVCRVCKMQRGDFEQGEATQPDLKTLIAIVPRIDEWTNEDMATQSLEESLVKLREASANCPACILAALRQSGCTRMSVLSFNFKQEMKAIWDAINENNWQEEVESQRYAAHFGNL